MADLKAPRESTIRKLFALSSNRCAFPSCRTPIIDPQSGTVLAEICHIRARNSNWPRFDASQTAEERHSFQNLILMCEVHHKLIDARENTETHSTERLLEMKATHESAATSDQALPVLTDSAVRALLATIAEGGPPSQFDFRGATLKAGGEGGRTGGGGGGGGVIQLVGSTIAGGRAKIDLSGRPGRAPGGGGGGGAVIRCSGRPATFDDVQNGLRVSTITTANAADVRDSLLFVLGGGAEWIKVSQIPGDVRVGLACIFEAGTIALETLLAISVVVLDPSKRTIISDDFDVAFTGAARPVRRRVVCRTISFRVTEAGLWSFSVRSRDIELASLEIEMRGPP